MQAHYYYPGYLEWKELPEGFDELKWPDQVAQRGRPRAIKFGYVKLALGYGVHARASHPTFIWKKFQSPWIPVYRATSHGTIMNLKTRFCNNQFNTLVPKVGKWEWQIERQDNGWYYLFLRYIPPFDMNELNKLSLAWIFSPQWLNSMIDNYNDLLEKEQLEQQRKVNGLPGKMYGDLFLDATPEQRAELIAEWEEEDDNEPLDLELMREINPDFSG